MTRLRLSHYELVCRVARVASQHHERGCRVPEMVHDISPDQHMDSLFIDIQGDQEALDQMSLQINKIHILV